MQLINMALIIISDRATTGERKDSTVPAVLEWCSAKPFDLVEDFIVPDEADEISAALKAALNSENVDVIFTSGGTGFAERDITPEVTKKFITKFTPGMDEYLRIKGLAVTPHAALSRGISGISGNKLIINLPGNPKAVVENLEWLTAILPHAVKVLKGPVEDKEHNYKTEQ